MHADDQWLMIFLAVKFEKRAQIWCQHLTKSDPITGIDFRGKNWLILYKRRQTIARIFQLNDNNFEITQDIDLKFLAFVHHMSGLNWGQKF